MKLGMYTDLRNPDEFGVPWADHYSKWLDRIVAADEMGAAEVWLSEHHFYEDGYLPQPLTYAAAIAGRTNNIRIGTSVLLIALRQSLQLAEEAAIVDILSNGRLDLGVGVGYRPREFEAFGADIGRRFRLVEQRVNEVREWWTGGELNPPPVQTTIPFWGGFFKERGARMAGRLGMGVMPQVSVAHSILEPYRAGLEEGGFGRDAARYRMSLPLFLADDPEAVQPILDVRQGYQNASYQRHDVSGPTGSSITPNAVPSKDGAPARKYPALRPEDAVGYIEELTRGLPVEQVYCWSSPGVMPDDLVDRHLELMFTELAPAVAHLGIEYRPQLA